MDGEKPRQLKLNDIVPTFSRIRYTCNTNHYFDGVETNWCLSDKWQIATVSDCKPKCAASRVSSISYVTQCSLEVNGISEDVTCRSGDMVDPGTEARIACQTGYRSSVREQELVCQADGNWDKQAFPCSQICGQEGASGTPYIVGGVQTKNSKVPWHIGIYTLTDLNAEPTYICGGSIVSAKVIVSAIHCFWDPTTRQLNPVEQFRIVAGKYYSRFNDGREKNSFQVMHVSNIYYPEEYQHGHTFYDHDLAVVVLDKHIEFKSHIAPVCLEYNLGPEERFVEPGWMGRIAGWGLESEGGSVSDALKMIELPVVGRSECLEKVPLTFQPFLTGDKFCAGKQYEGIGLCTGDSGGGFVVPKKVNGKQYFFLRGVVSVGQNNKGNCDSNQYTLFTNVNHYVEFIKRHIEANRPEKQHGIVRTETTKNKKAKKPTGKYSIFTSYPINSIIIII